jgi:hypothetical protein
MNKYVDFHIEGIRDKSDARKVLADLENSEEVFTHDLKVYLSYKEYEAVGELAEMLNEFKTAINDIKKKFKL